MSCGFTTRTRTSADFAAVALSSTLTPYLALSTAAWSVRFSVMERSATSRPDRIRPDSRVSPMTPAPKIAVVAMTSALRRDAAEEEHEVPRLLGHAAHEVAVPLLAVGDVDAHLVAAVGDALLLLGADPVEHLVLEGVGVAVVVGRERARDLDEPWVVAGHHGVAVARHEDLQAAHVVLVHVGRRLVRDRLGLLVGALAEPDPAPLVREVAAVTLAALEVRLDDGAHPREVLAQLAQGLQRGVGGRVVLHVEGHGGAGVRGRLADLARVVEGDLVAV